MEKLIETLNHYELITCLIPGLMFCQFTDWLYGTGFITDNSVTLIISGYVFGQVISRLGSLVVEPVCKKLKIIIMAPYHDWLEAIKADDKISTITEKSTVYRSWVALVLIHIFMPCVINLNECVLVFGYQKLLIIQLFILTFFLLAYRKQVAYVRKRVQKIVPR